MSQIPSPTYTTFRPCPLYRLTRSSFTLKDVLSCRRGKVNLIPDGVISDLATYNLTRLSQPFILNRCLMAKSRPALTTASGTRLLRQYVTNRPKLGLNVVTLSSSAISTISGVRTREPCFLRHSCRLISPRAYC